MAVRLQGGRLDAVMPGHRAVNLLQPHRPPRQVQVFVLDTPAPRSRSRTPLPVVLKRDLALFLRQWRKRLMFRAPRPWANNWLNVNSRRRPRVPFHMTATTPPQVSRVRRSARTSRPPLALRSEVGVGPRPGSASPSAGADATGSASRAGRRATAAWRSRPRKAFLQSGIDAAPSLSVPRDGAGTPARPFAVGRQVSASFRR